MRIGLCVGPRVIGSGSGREGWRSVYLEFVPERNIRWTGEGVPRALNECLYVRGLHVRAGVGGLGGPFLVQEEPGVVGVVLQQCDPEAVGLQGEHEGDQ